MVAGRPRTVSLSPDQMIELGKEMIKWVKLYNPAHLKAWWSVEKEYTEGDWSAMRQSPEFLEYYARAMDIISLDYLDKESKIPDKIKDRFLRLYFKDLRDDENDTKKFDASLGQSITDKSPHQPQIDQMQSIMEKDHKIAQLQALIEKQAKELGHQC